MGDGVVKPEKAATLRHSSTPLLPLPRRRDAGAPRKRNFIESRRLSGTMKPRLAPAVAHTVAGGSAFKQG
jgi:hypothetical protein